MNVNDTIPCHTGGSTIATVVKINSRTLIVRLPNGNVIKRHKVKHLGWKNFNSLEGWLE